MNKKEVIIGIKRQIKRLLPVDYIRDRRAESYRTRVNRNKAAGRIPIRVCFLVQMASLWDKQEPVYARMAQDDRFDVKVLVVPSYDFVSKRVNTAYDDNYFFEKYPDAIRACQDGSWVQLETLDFDYVFYQRPYDWYLPDGYKSSHVVHFAKCCYIPYAFWPLKASLCGYNKEFYRNVAMAFMESPQNREEIAKRERDNKRILFMGYPLLENIGPTDAWNAESIMWAPRWNYDDHIGGSHFFEYKDSVLELKKEYPQSKVIIRPHPLAFENYIRLGMMREQDVEDYRKKVDDSGASFDSNALIEDSFRETGVLITDVSSIVYPFFMSGKPIIFCSTDVPLSPSFKALFRGMYIARTWEDVEKYYKEIRAGNDYLKDTRREMAMEMQAMHVGASDRIVSYIVSDHNA